LSRYRDDPTHAVPLRWFTGGRIVTIDRTEGPLLLLGADAIGRDVFSRLLYGAQLSLGVTAIGLAGALVIGVVVGGLAGSIGGRVDSALMLLSDVAIVLPGTYLVLTLRGLLPLTLSTAQVFGWISVLFAISAWPHVARGVRAIVATERARDYAEAARAAGARPLRVLAHLLPAARGFLFIEALLLVPALLVSEVTVSLLGLGFPDSLASWGTMLGDAQNGATMRLAPWTLAPAIAIFLVVLALHLVGGSRTDRDLTDTLSAAPGVGR
jgi:peptide/nickel transport system permease protein